MKEKENIAVYLLWVDEVGNTIIGLVKKVNESVIVQKVLRTLPLRFDAKVSTLEEKNDLYSLTMDELHGILTTYEMRIGNEKPSRRRKKEECKLVLYVENKETQ